MNVINGNKVPLKYTERMFKECINIKNIDLEKTGFMINVSDFAQKGNY